MAALAVNLTGWTIFEQARLNGLDETAAVAASMAGAQLHGMDEIDAGDDLQSGKGVTDAVLRSMEAEVRALEAAANARATGTLPGEDDDIGVPVKWAKFTEKGERIRVRNGKGDGIGRHVPVCVRPGIVVQQRTLSRQDAVRRQTVRVLRSSPARSIACRANTSCRMDCRKCERFWHWASD